MLILTRHQGQVIKIGDNIEIMVLNAHGPVSIGITAPTQIPVHREEIYKKIQDEKRKEKQASRK